MTEHSSVLSTHTSPSWKRYEMRMDTVFEVLQMFRNEGAHSNPSS